MTQPELFISDPDYRAAGGRDMLVVFRSSSLGEDDPRNQQVGAFIALHGLLPVHATSSDGRDTFVLSQPGTDFPGQDAWVARFFELLEIATSFAED